VIDNNKQTAGASALMLFVRVETGGTFEQISRGPAGGYSAACALS